VDQRQRRADCAYGRRGLILPAQRIRMRCISANMVQPFNERSVCYGMSYGLSPAGYDIRIGQDILLKPGKFALASSIERFNMPTDVLGTVHDKSTWARRGLAVQTTVVECGWKGHLTLELTNHSDANISLKHGMPIAQIIFHQLQEPTDQPYAGKYQDQPNEPTPARRRRRSITS